MLATFLSLHPAFTKYAAWFILVLMFVLSGQSLKQAFVALLLKLYEVLIQGNSLG